MKMETTEDILQKEGFKEVYVTRFASVLTHEEKGVVVCQLLEEYVPIEFFKKTFLEISKIVEKGNYTKFIFDKRALRTFHQPSMEWYFIYWKKDMLAHGMSKHRKILPELEWFKKAVMIAKHELEERYPENIISKLDIKYCDSFEEAITV